ncbi:MAG: hydroxyacylglutathione hydrolase [Legionella sp.]|nr:MAG: hydroxyacylglutathione hydrolase [Legionella sp.]
MSINPVPAFNDNYIWVLQDDQTDLFDCVDPGDAQPIIQYAKDRQLQLRAILLTHHHADHIGGVAALIQAFPSCRIYGPQDSRIPHVTDVVQAHESIHLGSNHFKILSNPGHTSTHISYYEPQKGLLFCGDTLFSAGCGRVFDGTIEELHQSLLLFKNLPLTTQVFCAHEYTLQNLAFAQQVEPQNQAIKTYIEQIQQQKLGCTLPSILKMEREINPFLRTDIPEVIHYARSHGAAAADSLTVFTTLRECKNRFK